MITYFSRLTLIVAVYSLCCVHVVAEEPCGVAQPCKSEFGASATTCANSSSRPSKCARASEPSHQPVELADVNKSTILGRFDSARDLLLANFDGRPDPDDIHAVAALGTLLKDPRFSAVNYYAVAGTYGTQGGAFIEADRLFNMAFGRNHWANAHRNYAGALNSAYQKAHSVLSAGGDMWVQEAGQSDFSADLVRRIKQHMPEVDTKTRIHIVQHSQWNQDKTKPVDLTYVKNNTDYHKIEDGNVAANGTPGFNSRDTSQWQRVLSNTQVGAIWAEAKRVADDSIAQHVGWQNPSIKNGGMDFSDTVEDTWIFGFNHLTNNKSFFNEFL